MVKASQLVKAAEALFNHADLKHVPAAGFNKLGANELRTPLPTNDVVVQATEKKEHWSQIDCQAQDRQSRIFAFGGSTSGYLLVAGTHRLSEEPPKGFDAQGFRARTDLLISMATGDTVAQALNRLWGVQPVLTEDELPTLAMAQMLSLAQALNEYNFLGALEDAARQRGLGRLYFHVPGQSQRHQQLIKGLGFKRTKVSDGGVFTRLVT